APPPPPPPAVVRPFELPQYLSRAFDSAGRQAGQTADFDAVRTVGPTRLKAVQEDNVVADLADRHVAVDEGGKQVGELGQFVVVRREDRLRPARLVEMLR